MLQQFCQWLYDSQIGTAIRESIWVFPIIETIHVLAMALLVGTIAIFDLRLLGLILKREQRLEKELRPCLPASLAVAVLSGLLLLAEEPLKCYYSPAFRAKMLSLALAVLFYFLVQGRLLRLGDAFRPWLTRSAGAVSLILWLTVGLAGRAIGFI